MNKRIKKLWIKDLRSGKFNQGRSLLCSGAGDDAAYCCMGILERLASLEGVVSSPEGTDRIHIAAKTRDWAGLKERNPILDKTRDDRNYAEYLNDHGETFEQIADRIEKYL